MNRLGARGRAVRRSIAGLSIFIISCATPASAQAQQTPATMPAADSARRGDPHAVQPERPTVATHAGTVAPGWFELETGVERDHFGPSANSLTTPTVFKFGIADNVQFSLFGNLSKPPGSSAGLGDVAAGVKWRLVDDAPIVGDFAILPIVKFPTGSSTSGTGTGTTDVSIVLISSHSFGSVAMDLNVGYTHRSGDGSNAPKSATLWTASFGGSLGDSPIGWAAECYGYPATSGPAGQSSTVALLGGPTLQVQAWLVFDAGIIVPVSGPQPKALYAGVTYNIGRLWKAH